MRRPDYDVSAAQRRLARGDSDFARLIDHIGDCQLRIAPLASSFSGLAHSIVYQQLSGAAAATIFARLCDALGQLSPGQVLAASDQTLRGAGLARGQDPGAAGSGGALSAAALAGSPRSHPDE